MTHKLFSSLMIVLIITACAPATSAPAPTTTPVPATSTATIISTPTLGIGSTLTSDKDGMTLLYVPAGDFMMGNDADDALAECQKFRSDCQLGWFTDERPPHSVHVDDFWIDQTEVTNAMYAKCVADGICKEPTDKWSYSHPSYYDNPEFDRYPVIFVDWNMAKTYCEWAGRRLLTEAEWEKAARGENASVYPWSDTFDGSLVNFCDTNCTFDDGNKSFNDGFADVAPVGSYPSGKSVYGALDMAGNVWEWVADWYGARFYSNSPFSNPLGPASGQYRVLRGGSWYSNINFVRSADRLGHPPTNSDFFIGFRCSRSL